MMTVRPERVTDYEAIDEVNRRAFGQEAEVRLVRALRKEPGFDPRLSMVAVRAGRMVGHILFSPIRIENVPRFWPAISLAPVSVLPEFHRQGIGSRLVRDGLAACQTLGHGLVVVLGHPEYYPRFGFVPASRFGIRVPFPVPDEAFMVIGISPGALDGVSGAVRYPTAVLDAM
ncbi:MAG TPA: N-acetyltransferase [Phycisphaerae bacterium]|nr:N-acetyltransferase [Phycisphaerae bacterium]